MRVTLDRSGRFTVPAEIRRQLAWEAGPVEISVQGTSIVIVPIPQDRGQV